MRLILRYNWNIPYEASGTETIPFEYSSKEDAFIDFFALFEDKDSNEGAYYFHFAGHEWSKYDDLENDVKFFELEEWFDLYKARIPV